MINIKSEKLVSLIDAAAQVPGRARHIKTMHRWRLKGVRGTKLECVSIGREIYTSEEALDRFFAALSGQPATVPTSPTAAQRSRRSRAADAALASRGI